MAALYSNPYDLIVVVMDHSDMDLWGRVLKSSHHLRHKVCVEKLNWQAVKSYKGMEFDAYDNHESSYIIVANQDHTALAMVRLRPTTTSYMIKDAFSDKYSGHLHNDASVYEISRLIWDDASDELASKEAVLLLKQAVLKFASDNDITKYVGVLNTAAFRVLRSFGGHLSQTGTMIDDEGKVCRFAELTIHKVKDRMAGGLIGVLDDNGLDEKTAYLN